MRIAIVGAGIGGMAAAYDLARAGHTVTIYEAAEAAGGLAAGFKEPGWDWSVERFYHHWFGSDRHILGLIDELGWKDRVRFPRPYTVMYHEGKFYPFDSMFSNIPLFVLRFYPLQFLRIALVGLYLRLTNNWKSTGTIHRRRLDAPLGGQSRLRADVGADDGRQVWRALCEGGQHGLAVGAVEVPDDPPGHLRGRVPGLCRRFCRPPAPDGR